MSDNHVIRNFYFQLAQLRLRRDFDVSRVLQMPTANVLITEVMKSHVVIRIFTLS